MQRFIFFRHDCDAGFSWLAAALLLTLVACGGGGGGDSDSGVRVTISGRATYDFIPFKSNNIGLDYSAAQEKPIRGAVVEVLGGNGRVLGSAITDDAGAYSVSAPENMSVRVRVKAQLKRSTAPTWDMKTTDNTKSNALYALDGNLASSGNADSVRNLHALSGWGGSSYTSVRAAAPFAILDSVYAGLQRLVETGQTTNFPPLELRWSVNNNSASNPNNDFTTGEIGTSFYQGDAVYILGEVNSDTDEFDSHVILHEWGHYIEASLSRTESIGGAHTSGDRLDMRVSLSEGFGNAFAAMILDNPNYRDSGGAGQANGFTFDVSVTNHANNGWYNEGSVESILYNHYVSDNGKTARDMAPLMQTLMSTQFKNAPSLATIFLLSEKLLDLYPDHADVFESLLEEQIINSTNQFGIGETNNANSTLALPVYKTLLANGTTTNVCSGSPFGKYNKLGVAQFLRLDITQGGNYTLIVSRNGGAPVPTDPDFKVYLKGETIASSDQALGDYDSALISLDPATYIVEIYDWNNRNSENNQNNTTCFDVQISQ